MTLEIKTGGLVREDEIDSRVFSEDTPEFEQAIRERMAAELCCALTLMGNRRWKFYCNGKPAQGSVECKQCIESGIGI